ncbi:hypothetical protein ACJA88_008600 [Fusarium oxysporum]
MATLKVLICGGGCAGPALAFWLTRLGHHVTIVERFPALRATGAQIDFREQGIATLKVMGLMDEIRARLVDEAGVAFVDTNGKILGTVLANTSGKGAQSITSEFEIMRGDVVRILYDATKDDVEYVFNKTVGKFEQDDKNVLAHFSDGTSDTFDILVGADGQGSRIRKAIEPANAPDPYRKLGHIKLLYLILKDDSPEVSSIHRGSVEQQKEFWTQRFRGAGWQTERFLEGMKTTENFYSQEVVQVQTTTWHKGRVVLLGDAAYCPSPFSGMGTTLGFIGAYVLAGEIQKNPENLSLAFENYDKVLRPFVDEVQNIKLGLIRWAIPDTQLGVTILQWIAWFVCLLRIPYLISRFSSEEKAGWPLPKYPALKVSK